MGTMDSLKAERDEAEVRVSELEAQVVNLRRALDDIDRYTYGWSFGTAYTVIENIRVRVRRELADVYVAGKLPTEGNDD